MHDITSKFFVWILPAIVVLYMHNAKIAVFGISGFSLVVDVNESRCGIAPATLTDLPISIEYGTANRKPTHVI